MQTTYGVGSKEFEHLITLGTSYFEVFDKKVAPDVPEAGISPTNMGMVFTEGDNSDDE